jgi:XTP/dITP diphosphohydrolase
VTQVFLASRNREKLRELRRILSAEVPGIEVLGLDDVAPYDEPAETEPTFVGNALVKARAGAAATRLPALADDSGICIDALNGMPGVLSARWAGRAKDDAANNALVLQQLRDVPQERRGAEFRCAVALCLPGGREHVENGVLRGRIGTEMRGGNGFGYDVLFVPAGSTRTNAELSAPEKDAISHRGIALRAMTPVLTAWLADSGDGGAGGS